MSARTATGQYSDEHKLAFRKLDSSGWNFDVMSEAELKVLADEDRNIASDILVWRQKKAREAEERIAKIEADAWRRKAVQAAHQPIDATKGFTPLLSSGDSADGASLDAWIDKQKGDLPTPFEITRGLYKWLSNMHGVIKSLRVRDLYARIETLENEVKALKQRPTLKFVGPFVQGTEYEPGNTVQYKGAVWHADCRTTQTPDDLRNQKHWTLMCRAGRDAR